MLHSTYSVVEGRIIQTPIPGAGFMKQQKDIKSYYIPKNLVFKMPGFYINAPVPDPDSTDENVHILFKGFKCAPNTGNENDSDGDDGESETDHVSHQVYSFAPELPPATAPSKRNLKGKTKKNVVAQAEALGDVVPALESKPNRWISEYRVPVSFLPGDFVQVTNDTWLGSFLGQVVAIEPNPRFIREHAEYVVVQVPYEDFNIRRTMTFSATTVFVSKSLAQKCLIKVRK